MSQDRWIKRENWLQDQESREINRAILGLHSLRYLVLTGKNGGLYDYSNYMKEIRSEGVAAFEAEKEAAKAEAERQRIAQEKAEREAAQAASQVIARESYYSKFGQFFKSMWSRFTDSRLGRFLKIIGQTLFSNR